MFLQAGILEKLHIPRKLEFRPSTKSRILEFEKEAQIVFRAKIYI